LHSSLRIFKINLQIYTLAINKTQPTVLDLSMTRPHSFQFREGLGTRLAHSHPRGRSLPMNSIGTAATPVGQWSKFKATQKLQSKAKVDHKYQWSMVNGQVAVCNQGVAMYHVRSMGKFS